MVAHQKSYTHIDTHRRIRSFASIKQMSPKERREQPANHCIHCGKLSRTGLCPNC